MTDKYVMSTQVALCCQGAGRKPGSLELHTGAKRVSAPRQQLSPLCVSCPPGCTAVQNGAKMDKNRLSNALME